MPGIKLRAAHMVSTCFTPKLCPQLQSFSWCLIYYVIFIGHSDYTSYYNFLKHSKRKFFLHDTHISVNDHRCKSSFNMMFCVMSLYFEHSLILSTLINIKEGLKPCYLRYGEYVDTVILHNRILLFITGSWRIPGKQEKCLQLDKYWPENEVELWRRESSVKLTWSPLSLLKPSVLLMPAMRLALTHWLFCLVYINRASISFILYFFNVNGKKIKNLEWFIEPTNCL